MGRSRAALIEAANVALIVDRNLDKVGDYFAVDYVVHFTEQDLTGGHELLKKAIRTYWRAFSEFQVDITILVTEKKRIAWLRTIRATQTGAFKGFPATGRPIVWRDMVTSEFRDGLIAEEWVVTDLAERLLLARKG